MELALIVLMSALAFVAMLNGLGLFLLIDAKTKLTKAQAESETRLH